MLQVLRRSTYDALGLSSQRDLGFIPKGVISGLKDVDDWKVCTRRRQLLGIPPNLSPHSRHLQQARPAAPCQQQHCLAMHHICDAFETTSTNTSTTITSATCAS